MKVAFVLYDNFTMLDIVGPYNVLTMMPDCEPVWVAEKIGAVIDHTRVGALVANTTFAECSDPDIVVAPGGLGTELHFDGPVVEWLRTVKPHAQWMTSVCTGSLLLGSAGFLEGLTATSHWASMDALAHFGATPTHQRVVFHKAQRLVTSAGVSSGIDMALTLVEHIHDKLTAETIQLLIEYDPQPPVDSGCVTKASPEAMALAAQLMGGSVSA
tara:strand:+ start:27951 stop:28592 length:642 start_codon:yes stop_codon:yes gene_type:complete